MFKYSIIILFTLFTFFTNNIFAQKCEYERDEIDALTEMVVKRTAPQMLFRLNNNPVNIKAQCIGRNKYLKISYFKYNGFDIEEDREIALILSSGEEVVLFPRAMPQDTAQTDSYLDVTSLLIYKLSADQYNILTDKPVVAFKYYMETGWVSESLKESRQNVIKDLLRCVE